MKFYSTEKYREFRGYVFANGHPVTINDRAAIEAMLKEPTLKEFNDEAPKETETAKTPVLDPFACPKCGRHVKQGRFLHVKHCKG